MYIDSVQSELHRGMGRRAKEHSWHVVQCGGCAHIEGVVEDLAADVAIRISGGQTVRILSTASVISLMDAKTQDEGHVATACTTKASTPSPSVAAPAVVSIEGHTRVLNPCCWCCCTSVYQIEESLLIM